MSADYRDGLIAHLAYREAELTEELTSARLREQFAVESGEAYRLVAVSAFHHAHRLQGERDGLEAKYHRALDDARGLRVALMARAGVTADAAAVAA